jgi:hypothetical protein
MLPVPELLQEVFATVVAERLIAGSLLPTVTVNIRLQPFAPVTVTM